MILHIYDFSKSAVASIIIVFSPKDTQLMLEGGPGMVFCLCHLLAGLLLAHMVSLCRLEKGAPSPSKTGLNLVYYLIA